MSRHDEPSLDDDFRVAQSNAARDKLRLMPDAPMSDKQAAMIDAALAAAERRGEQQILREIAKLPLPYSYCSIDGAPGFVCDWCSATWAGRGFRLDNPHPDNGCLWPRAQQAAQEQE